MFGDPCSEGAAADNNDIERPTALLPPGLRLGEVVAERPWMSLVNEVNSLLFAISPSAGELQASSLSQVHVHFCVGVHTRRLGCNGVGNAWIQRQSLARTALLSRQMPQMPPNPKTV